MKHDHPQGTPCKEVFEMLSEYLDMTLPPETCEEVRAHLEDCPPCIEFADSLKKTIDMCRQYAPTGVPAPLSESSRHELEAAYKKMLAARAALPPASPGAASSDPSR